MTWTFYAFCEMNLKQPKSPLGNESHADSDEISNRNGDQGEQTVNDGIERVISGPAAILAWLVLVAIILVAAAIGIVGEHGPTATAILAAIAIVIGLVAAIAALKKSKGSNVLAVTAALSAFSGLLVSQADTIQEIATKRGCKNGNSNCSAGSYPLPGIRDIPVQRRERPTGKPTRPDLAGDGNWRKRNRRVGKCADLVLSHARNDSC